MGCLESDTPANVNNGVCDICDNDNYFFIDSNGLCEEIEGCL